MFLYEFQQFVPIARKSEDIGEFVVVLRVVAVAVGELKIGHPIGIEAEGTRHASDLLGCVWQ